MLRPSGVHLSPGESEPLPSNEESHDCKPASSPELIEALHRLLTSHTFERSPRLRLLIGYIANAMQEDRLQDLKEQSIGQTVFGRPAGYNHAEDNIVRVTARQLRSKIEEYYHAEGQADTVMVEIPRGSYVPVLASRTPPEAVVAEAPAATPEPHEAHRIQPSAWKWLALSFGLVSVVLAILLVSARKQPPAQTRTSPTGGLLNLLTPKPGRRLNIVPADATVQFYRNLTGKDVPLGAYANRSFLSASALPPELQYGSQVWKYLDGSRTSDLTGLVALGELLPYLPGDQISVRHPSHLSARDFYDDNFILISSGAANPWVQLFEPRLNFQIETTSALGQVIRNRNPLTGEREMYSNSAPGNGSHTVYCRVAMVPNFSGRGWVLLLSGPNAAGVEGAADYVKDAREVQQLASTLHASVDHMPAFELLLRVTAAEGVASNIEVISARRVHGAH